MPPCPTLGALIRLHRPEHVVQHAEKIEWFITRTI